MTTPIGMSPTALNTAQRETLVRVLDVLIPAAAGMPSGAEVGVADRWIDEALRLRPDLRDDLLHALETLEPIDAGLEDALRAYAKQHPEAFVAVGVLVSGAYYMDDRARLALGYPGQEDRRLVDDTGDYLDMLERVVERGPIFRPTPAEGAEA
ncbi:hypothetical protein IDH50_17310 [Aeromicrobium tamlense]|uniref:Uncharacterized protein n=1 Tax=Aeromicrobium tamlense TaxID=375541 RepID=A0A8I0G1V3_9ACTN|nr:MULTISPECIES: hypothetical protein [Aeromicrobium]MBD1272007.1 hypothetical protein [Aeromicrobium tamlense]NYI38801.1 hypothetical protein [Aeromicrobium tamlense]